MDSGFAYLRQAGKRGAALSWPIVPSAKRWILSLKVIVGRARSWRDLGERQEKSRLEAGATKWRR